jgi:hypothetical protein
MEFDLKMTVSIWKMTLEDDCIDMGDDNIDMGYLVTLPGRC